MRIGILTGGGDAPGLNGIIESCSKTLLKAGHTVIGICDGFEGIFAENHKELTLADVEGAHAQAGTILGTSNKSDTKGREKEFIEKFKKLQLSGLIACGGDGTFSGLKAFSNDIPLLGVPKTIDNDLSGTDITFGYDTACSVVAEAADALRATANAHKRIIFVETMGRTAGWIALGGGLASYADAILIPERPFDKEKFVSFIREKQKEKKRGLVVVIAEGAHSIGENPQVAFMVPGSPQAERYGGISQTVSRWIQAETGWDSRSVVLGHLQRSKHPTTTDRFLTAAMGVEVATMAMENKWGNAVVYRNGLVQRAPLADLMGPARLIAPDHRWVKLALALGIFI
jgi:6-phosphofructokinase 1